jgi:hypothetical protein
MDAGKRVIRALAVVKPLTHVGGRMERKDLNPMEVDRKHWGKRLTCCVCPKQNLYEAGYTFQAVTENDQGEAHLVYYWFCSIRCLLSNVRGGNA